MIRLWSKGASHARKAHAWPGGISRVPAKTPWRLRASFQGNAAKNIRFYAMYVTQGC